MAERICSIEGCERNRYGHGYCAMHWKRWRKHGDPLGGRTPNGNYAECVVDGCAADPRGYGYCGKHYKRWKSTGSPFETISGKQPGRVTSYSGMHAALQRIKGTASAHGCIRCGNEATQWAYDHTDPAQLYSERGFPWSQDPAHYIPLCKPCHNVFDKCGRR